jgi:hypothetical protein
MKLSEKLKIRGEVTITATDKDGNVRSHSQPNLITTEGFGFFVSKIFDKESLAYAQTAPGTPPGTTDTVKFYISEIGIGTTDTAATSADTYNNQITLGEKKIKPLSGQTLVEDEGTFYFQSDFRSVDSDTLLDTNTQEVPIKEVLLIAKNGPFFDVVGSAAPPRKLIARTVLSQEFIKYRTDRISVAWKIILG